MNYTKSTRHSPLFPPARNFSKSALTEAYTSSCMAIKPTVTPSINIIRSSNKNTSKATQSTPNKWFQQPKIPIRLNSSTLIRIKSKNQSVKEVIHDDRENDQLAITAMSFLKRDRRMSDYEVAKGMSPFGDTSFVKNVFMNIITKHKAKVAATAASANPSGDAGPTTGTYQRISAFSLNDSKTGCNLKYIERVLFERNGSAPQSSADMQIARHSYSPAATSEELSSFGVDELSAMLQQTNMAKCGRLPQNSDSLPNHYDTEEESSQDERRCRKTMTVRKKKSNRKNKRAVVVTSLKNSSVRFVRKPSNYSQ